jgi:hypothetical protein
MPKKKLSKETNLEKIRASLKDAPTTTKVKAWTFQIENQNYVIISYFLPRLWNCISIFPSNKKGVKTSNKEILTITNSTDYLRGFNEVLKILVPEEFTNKDSELLPTIS